MWKKQLVVKVLKKRSLHKCNNCRAVTLLPVSRKIYCRMQLERIKEGVDKKLRKEQTGFRPKKSATEHIFMLDTPSSRQMSGGQVCMRTLF